VTPRVFRCVPIEGGAEGAAGIARADVEVAGLDHGGPSFEVRIFLGNPDADAATPPTPENGYAASIHVYGMGMPVGGGPPPLRKTRSVIATDAVRAVAAAGSHVDVTLVAVPAAAGQPHPDLGDVAVAVRVGDRPDEAA
jgi:hypothetical protein